MDPPGGASWHVLATVLDETLLAKLLALESAAAGEEEHTLEFFHCFGEDPRSQRGLNRNPKWRSKWNPQLDSIVQEWR